MAFERAGHWGVIVCAWSNESPQGDESRLESKRYPKWRRCSGFRRIEIHESSGRCFSEQTKAGFTERPPPFSLTIPMALSLA